MFRNRFKQTLSFLHFANNDNLGENSERLTKVKPFVDYFLQKFHNVYTLEQNLALDEGMIPLRWRLRFWVFNLMKLIKYGILNRMVCESDSGYIFNLPEELKSVRILVDGSKHIQKDGVLLLVWTSVKKRDVRMISTIHNSYTKETGKIDRSIGLPIRSFWRLLSKISTWMTLILLTNISHINPILRKTEMDKKSCLLSFQLRVFQFL